MSSLRDKEGYLMIDHRASPGLSAEDIQKMQINPGLASQLCEGRMLEAPTATCSHCQAIVILNASRTRDRAVCLKCYNYVCDACNVALVHGKDCKPWSQVVAEIHEEASRSFNIKVL